LEEILEFHLTSLVLAFKKETVTIPFTEVSYFWGQMGAGKTSIARLIDYCLGGSMELSPALQSEFVSATLNLKLQKGDLQLERPREANLIVAQWGSKMTRCKSQYQRETRMARSFQAPESKIFAILFFGCPRLLRLASGKVS